MKINLQMMMKRLLPGETYKVGNIYVKNQKVLFARLVLYRLTEKQLRERQKKQMKNEKKTVFDIMGVHYKHNIAREQKKAA